MIKIYKGEEQINKEMYEKFTKEKNDIIKEIIEL
jgi:hypothetical protein